MRLQEDVAIVTGGASGIGRAIVSLFAEEGAAVVSADLQRESRFEEEQGDIIDEIVNAGGTGIYVETDVTDRESVAALVEHAIQRFGKVSVLVNNAGVFVRNSIVDVSDSEWDHVLDLNLRGYFYMCRAVIPHMLTRGEGRIVNISSIHGIRGTGSAATYCASKGGIENLTKQLAAEYASHNIRVNAISPGTIRTAMCLPYLNTPELLAEYERRTLLPRLGVPSDVAYAALYLASHESDFVVGHSLVVDGGWTIT